MGSFLGIMDYMASSTQLKTYRLIQDWMPYNDSLIFRYTSEYFKDQGIDAFAINASKNVVPNVITNTFPHAKSIASILKANLVNYPATQTIKILECGSGSCIFARHFLQAVKDLGFLDRVEYLVSDYSKKALEQVREKNILGEFEENKHYRYIELDLFNIDNSKDLDSNPFEVKDVSLVIMNYILCVLPLTILQRKVMGSNIKFDELYIRFFEIKDHKHNPDTPVYLEELRKERTWKSYKFDNQSDLELKYRDVIINQAKSYNHDLLYYAYGALAACDNLLERCDDNAFLFIADMPRAQDAALPYKIYANSVANPVNDGIIASYLYDKNVKSIRATDHQYLLLRMLIFKNPNTEALLAKAFREEFLLTNNTNIYLDLIAALDLILEPSAHEIFKGLIDMLLKIDPYSHTSSFFLGKYYKMLSDKKLATQHYKRAKELDFLNTQGLTDEIIESLLNVDIKRVLR